VELRRRGLEEAEHALGQANAELVRAKAALEDASLAEAVVAEQRDAVVARGLVERDWAEVEAWLARKREETQAAAGRVLERETAAAQAKDVVKVRTMEVFRLEALDAREREVRLRADARVERRAEDERASAKHARASGR
jgi:flagellar biosynthesis chaperone FliJ